MRFARAHPTAHQPARGEGRKIKLLIFTARLIAARSRRDHAAGSGGSVGGWGHVRAGAQRGGDDGTHKRGECRTCERQARGAWVGKGRTTRAAIVRWAAEGRGGAKKLRQIQQASSSVPRQLPELSVRPQPEAQVSSTADGSPSPETKLADGLASLAASGAGRVAPSRSTSVRPRPRRSRSPSTASTRRGR